jgi:broad specificity phosphatase PhoE
MIKYNDKRVFFVNHPEQRPLFEAEEYDYRYPGGENIGDVADRVEDWLKTISTEYAGKKILAVSHHETILVKRMLLEGKGKKWFLQVDEIDKPINCGVTTYRNNGKGLDLESYNVQHY